MFHDHGVKIGQTFLLDCLNVKWARLRLSLTVDGACPCDSLLAANDSSSLPLAVPECRVPDDRLPEETDTTEPVSSRPDTGH